MTPFDFAKEINKVEKKSEVLEKLHMFINNHNGDYNKDEIESFIKNISNEKFTSFGNKLGHCRRYCIEESKKTDNEKDVDYLRELNETEKILVELSSSYQIVVKSNAANKISNSQQAYTQNSEVLKEMNGKISEARKLVSGANLKIDKFTEIVDGKIYSVLLSTIEILGIFVAITFTGLGVMSLFSNINIEAALISTGAFIKNIFYLLLVWLASYNLLLILVYFLFQLSHRAMLNSQTLKNDDEKEKKHSSFTKLINLKLFVIIDAIVFALTITAFVFCLIV